jgi:Holliday junction resolvase RuvA-like protein
MTQLTAYLASAALFSFGIALLFAGHSLFVAARLLIGWLAAFAAIAFALAAIVSAAIGWIFGQGAPVSGALVTSGAALVAIGVAAKLSKPKRLARTAKATRHRPPASMASPAPAPRVTNAARDAIAALISLGYAKAEAASAIAAVAASLGSGADTPALVKAALRARNLSQPARA